MRQLSALASLAETTTRGLDYTHYNLLASFSLLSSTLASFAVLKSSTASLRSSFTASTVFMSQEIAAQASVQTADFDTRVSTLERLEARMRTGRGEMEDMIKRLEAVKQKIQSQGTSDEASRRGPWQRMTVKILMSILLVASSVCAYMCGG